jgi:hypothetical protein
VLVVPLDVDMTFYDAKDFIEKKISSYDISAFILSVRCNE